MQHAQSLIIDREPVILTRSSRGPPTPWMNPACSVLCSSECPWCRYQEIAALAVEVDKRLHSQQPQQSLGRQGSQGRPLHDLSQELVRVLLFAVIYLQILPVAYVPVVGEARAASVSLLRLKLHAWAYRLQLSFGSCL